MAILSKFRGFALISFFCASMLWAGISFGQSSAPSDKSSSNGDQASTPISQPPAAAPTNDGANKPDADQGKTAGDQKKYKHDGSEDDVDAADLGLEAHAGNGRQVELREIGSQVIGVGQDREAVGHAGLVALNEVGLKGAAERSGSCP